MRRKLILGERIMYGDGHTPLTCVFVAKIRGTFPPEALREALAKVQAKHPLLRVGIQEDKKGHPWFITHEEVPEIPVRIMERSGEDDWKQAAPDIWKHLFDLRTGPLAGLVWLRSAGVSELMLFCHHCICDGTSFVAIMRELLALLDRPDTDIGTDRPFNTLQELIPSSLLSDKRKILKGRLRSLLARVVFPLITPREKIPKEKDYMLHWKLSQAGSAALLNRCKAEQTTVHAALSVAFLRAFRLVKGAQARNKIITPVDIRRYVKEIKQDTLFAYAPIVHLQLNQPENGFWDQARKLKEELSEKINNMNVYEQLMTGEYIHASLHKLVKFLKSTEGSHDITFSNMGRLDIPEQYTSFEVETIYSPNVAFPWRNPNTLITTTFRGQMDFTLMSNESFLPGQEAKAVKEKAMEILLKEADRAVSK